MATATAPVRLSDAELKLLQSLVYQECGMYFDERRVHFLQDRLQRRLRACNIDTFYTYYRFLTSASGKGELSALLENLTINETSFFRNKPQLDLFHKVVLSELIERKEAANDFCIRLWSAGCSTGQEPYTLAMLVVDALAYHCLRRPQPPITGPKPLVPHPWRLEVVASDLSYAVLRAAQEASYPEAQLEQVDYTYRLRFFDRSGDKYVIKKALRELVQFDFHNLKTEFLPQKNDVIFCRNVMIYFDDAEQRRLVEKFYRCLNPDGYLFIGHAESLFGISDKFRMLHQKNGTGYQRVEETT
jgi:chemotaxis protein methyltransferase CheR